MRRRLMARARRRIAEHYPIVRDWLAAVGAGLSHVPPEAGAIACVRYPHASGSEELATRLRRAASVLVAPGAHFGLEGHVRIGFGGEAPALRAGLDRLGRLFASLAPPA